jgi:hypothetical protein
VQNIPSGLIGKEKITSARRRELRFLQQNDRSKKIVSKTQQILKKSLKRAKTEENQQKNPLKGLSFKPFGTTFLTKIQNCTSEKTGKKILLLHGNISR